MNRTSITSLVDDLDPIVDGLDPDAWDEIVLGLDRPHLLQGRTWGELKARWGWSIHHLTWTASGVPIAAAQVLVRRLGRLPIRVGYVPKGPLVNDVNGSPGAGLLREGLSEAGRLAVWQEVLADLARLAARLGLVYLKMDPDIPAADLDLAALWRRQGWRPSPEQIQFPNTMTSDLRGGEAAVVAAMKPKTRYNLKLAGERGVTVAAPGAAGIDTLYALYAQTGERAGFGLRSRAYYEDVWATLLAEGRAALFIAERHGEPLAGALPVAFGGTAWYLYGASAGAGREFMASYAVQMACLQWAIAGDCQTYDWWGGATVRNESDPLWGVHRFKEGFGAVWREQLGAWDLPVNRVMYRLYLRLHDLRRKRLTATRV